MGRKCIVQGCSVTVGLHTFPTEPQTRRRWLQLLGLEDDYELPVRAGVCDLHFARDAYDNIMQVEHGCVSRLLLKSEAVPSLALHRPRAKQRPLPALLPRGLLLEPGGQSAKRDVGCQTEPVVISQTCDQADVTQSSQTQASQATFLNHTCDLDGLSPESPRETSVPLKRRRFEVESTASSVDCSSTGLKVPPQEQKKYIVHEEQLLGLFQSCRVCGRRCDVDTATDGTLLQVKQRCPHCHFFSRWWSQPLVNTVPAGNLQLCAAVLFTGSSFSHISKFLEASRIQGVSEQCFSRLQAQLLVPTVAWQWKLEQDELLKEAADCGALTLGGDMHVDSTGHSVKYGSYTMMNLKTNKVMDIQLVQSNEAVNRVQMEKEGVARSLHFLEERGVTVQSIVSGPHSGVKRFLRKKKKKITHYFDPWHMVKGVEKKMDEFKKKRGSVSLWRKSVVNHLYWSASSSSSGQEAVAKWTSVAEHIQNRHNKSLFPQSEREARLKPSAAACEKLTSILLAPRFLKDVEQISPEFPTSTVEAFHSLIIRFCPKSVVFSFKGTLCRLQIAALHYNENAIRTRRTAFVPQCKRDHTVRTVKTKPTTLYVDKLMSLLFDRVVEDAVPYQQFAFDSIQDFSRILLS